MPFTASNGRRTKVVRSGVEFPIKRQGHIVAVLAIEKDAPEEVDVTLVDSVVVSFEDSTDIRQNTVVKARSFKIRDPKTDNFVAVSYGPPQEVISLK
ncbi:MAG: hypothetical protein NT026_00525 [Candidatus Staskawiczbacteria bacterium]|nr:hypothetical protein [Candidatus Staskawiczbacteria bacterium]